MPVTSYGTGRPIYVVRREWLYPSALTEFPSSRRLPWLRARLKRPIPMEILLLQDVAGIGKKNDLLVVGDGFALNCLLPQRKALVATPTVRKRYSEQITKRAIEKEKEKNVQQAAAAALVGKIVQFTRKATKTGKLYAAISAKEIAAAIKDQLLMDVSEDQVVITEHVKGVGNTQVAIKIGEQQHPITISVHEEKPAKAAKKAEKVEA